MHSGVCGLMRTTSVGGTKLFVTFIDDYLRKVWVYTMKCKGERFDKFKEFQALVETQTQYKIKVFRCMSGGDFISKRFEAFLWSTTLRARLNTLDQRGVQFKALLQ